ncbi:MAG: zinc-finger domain-containing protein, partial [Alphaproteobacteria bacterium]
NSKKVSCDGSSSASKHPLVYLYMGENDYVVCPYCSKFFSLNKTSNSNINILKNKKN